MARGRLYHSRCWLCGTSVLQRWNRIVYFTQLFGEPVSRALCWDCHANVIRTMRELKAQRP